MNGVGASNFSRTSVPKIMVSPLVHKVLATRHLASLMHTLLVSRRSEDKGAEGISANNFMFLEKTNAFEIYESFRFGARR